MILDDKTHQPDRVAQSYFRKIHRVYQELSEREDIADVHQRIIKIIGPELSGRVLDIGSGGVPDFETSESRVVISMDNIWECLRSSRGHQNTLDVTGDIRTLPLKDGSVDRILIQHVVHYLCDRAFIKNFRNVEKALAESARVLRKNGKIFIVDSMAPRALESVQRAAYALTSKLMRVMNKPMVFFLSPGRLCGFLKRSGLEPEKTVVINWGKMSAAGQTLFPHLKFPLRYAPVRCVIISAIKL
jgi:ubiquinone/menaquinone biosynthesis C-methylase UbiE